MALLQPTKTQFKMPRRVSKYRNANQKHRVTTAKRDQSLLIAREIVCPPFGQNQVTYCTPPSALLCPPKQHVSHITSSRAAQFVLVFFLRAEKLLP